MSIKAGLIDRLVGTTAIADLVGARVSAQWRDRDDPLPSISITRISGIPDYDLGGDAELAHDTFQIDCWASDTIIAEVLVKAVRPALSGFRGMLNGIWVNCIKIVNRSDDYTAPRTGERFGIARERIDIEVVYRDELN